MNPIHRRAFLRRAAAGTAAVLAPAARALPVENPLTVAVVFTEFTHRSHAHVFLENFLEPYLFNGRLTQPGVRVVSFYADQHPDKDMTPAVAKQYRIPVYPTIADALCLGG